MPLEDDIAQKKFEEFAQAYKYDMQARSVERFGSTSGKGKTMSKPNSVDAASLHPIVRRFSVGERIRINFFVDRRESGWHYGTVTSEPVNCYGTIAQKVQWDGPNAYESLMANSLFERV